ncbi:hypothetical protein HYE67_002687 [Fusarium culmorum]|uniref:Uncharacterized protein n=1 Tax=Fusarium culmorum TaxID=5516 RepID=A0A7S8D1W4_FUSCU|nr:hypothetical protein HYE67_002687 [Fusarium culmorum]
MACLYDLPWELLLEIIIFCNLDILSFVRAYPPAMTCFSANRAWIITHMMAPVGDVALPSLVQAARLRHMRQEPDFQALGTREVEERIGLLLGPVVEEPEPLCWDKFSLSALCIMCELGKDAKQICDAYSQDALAIITRAIARQLREPTQQERSLFIDVALCLESYCLTFFHGREHLYLTSEEPRQQFFTRHQWMSRPSCLETVERFYCTWAYMVKELRRLLAVVGHRLGYLYGRIEPLRNWGGRHAEYFLFFFQNDVTYKRMDCYGICLLSQGLSMFTKLRRMGDEELTKFIVANFWDIMEDDMTPLFHGDSLRWAYIDSLVPYSWRDIEVSNFVTFWSYALPFWDPELE